MKRNKESEENIKIWAVELKAEFLKRKRGMSGNKNGKKLGVGVSPSHDILIDKGHLEFPEEFSTPE